MGRIRLPDWKVKQIMVDQISRNFSLIGLGDFQVKLSEYFIVDPKFLEINWNGFASKITGKTGRDLNFIKNHFNK